MFIFSFFKYLKVYLVAYENVVAAVLGTNARREQLIGIACSDIHHLNTQDEGYRNGGAVGYAAKKLFPLIAVCAFCRNVGTPTDKVGHHLQCGLY